MNLRSYSLLRLFCWAILMVWLNGSSLWAQEAKFRQTFSVGLSLGKTFSRYTFVPSVRQSTYSGITTGLLLRYDVERSASILMEVNYDRVGWKERFDDEAAHYERQLDYLRLPILAHLYLPIFGQSRLFINAGPLVGFMLSSRAVETPSSSWEETVLERHSQSISKKFFWGLCGGPGLSIALSPHHRLEAEGRVIYGFGDILPNKRSDAYLQSNEMSLLFRINYLYTF